MPRASTVDTLKGKLCEALSSTLDLREALERAYPTLLQLVPADAAALGVFDQRRPLAYEWIETNLPPAFFSGYAEMAAEDFVRDAVAMRPGVAVRDDEMLDRRAIEQSALYQHARALGAPLEQVMAVMLPLQGSAQSGLALYRERRRPFSDSEQELLEGLTPLFANATRNCLLHERVALSGRSASVAQSSRQLATMLVAPPARELERTSATSPLLERWFDAGERRGDEVPKPLAELLARLTSAALPLDLAPAPFRRRLGDQLLEVSFLPVPESGAACWMLVFDVRYRPAWCDELTPRERQVLVALCNGWDNQLIATELGCTAETVKKHVSRVLQRAGAESRNVLAASRYDL